MNHDQLREATWRPMSEETRAIHQAAIADALTATPVRSAPLIRPRRRLAVVAVAAAVLALPTGIAVAAENALPGDALYPVKKITEQIRSIIDDDVVAEHRIEELEQLVAEDAPAEVIAEQVDRAAAEVDRLDPESDLVPRFATASDAVGDRPPLDEVVAEPPPVTSTTLADVPTTIVTDTTLPPTSDTTTVTTIPVTPDRTTTTVATTTSTVVDGTTTTTVPPDVTTVVVVGVVTSGPTCPVQTFPPDPACEDRPVAGAVLVIADLDGKEIRRVETTEEGRFELRLPTGAYRLIPQPYEGLLGTAAEQRFIIVGDGPVELLVGYDTGIR